ncbi:hyaluronidase [Chryseobacterium sp. 52]|uniref:hypothetical protein n=1 Tax=Chryseobacterium sp. 52 TaxID=2035213 RepID=UPI000C1861FA|nr:hypothetical protein [Chryseobacterium sp. 52]PIF47082.1 hyaluronidase [Chryseobacterium sp. 52]
MTTKLFTILIASILLLCTGNNKKHHVELSESASIQDKPQVLICSDNKSKTFVDFITRENIPFVHFVNDGQFMDSKTPFTFSKDLLLKELERSYPDPKSSGIAYIDIEYPYTDYLLKGDITSTNHKKSAKLFLDVLRFVKQQRPNVKWGYYGIPFTTYWGRDKNFYDQNKKVDQIIKESDVLFPSIYIFYNNVSFNLENKTYIQENTEEMLKIADRYNKKMYPFIMSRYHPSNQLIGSSKIDESDFKTYVSTLLQTQYKNKHIDGLVLWNADGYAYRVNDPVIKKEVEKNKISNFDVFYDQYVIGLLNLMKKEVKQNVYGIK